MTHNLFIKAEGKLIEDQRTIYHMVLNLATELRKQ